MSHEDLISSGVACRKMLATFARTAAEHVASQVGGAAERGLARRITEEHRVLQRTLSNLSVGFHAIPRAAPIDTAAIDLFVIDRNAVDVGVVQSAVDEIIRVLTAERSASEPGQQKPNDDGGTSICDGQGSP